MHNSPQNPPSAAQSPFLSFVVPIYNEERILQASLEALETYLDNLMASRGKGETWELVLVDDGSQDRGIEIATAWVEAHSNSTRYFQLPTNRGKGAAVRKGMLEAHGQVIFFLDADLSTPLEETAGMLGSLESGYDLVLGNRRVPGAHITRRQPRLRETLGRCFTLLVNFVLAPGVHDFTCGFKGFRREAAQAIFSRSLLDGWAFDAELVVIAQSRDLKLAQVPVAWHHEDDTKVKLVAAVFGSLRDLVTVLTNKWRGCYK
jgi:dolichyl-phosphate beta-glucosyltransferase